MSSPKNKKAVSTFETASFLLLPFVEYQFSNSIFKATLYWTIKFPTMHFSSFSANSFAIDLGNNNTLLTDQQGVLFSQPSFIAFDASTRSVKAVGDAAYHMFEKNHDELRPVKPLRGGVIADYESAATMIKEMVSGVYPKRWLNSFGHIISGIPFSTTEVERRALRDVMNQFHARKTHLFFEPLAAATGIGLNIQAPEGKMIVDIGGGITEIVVISLSGIAVVHSTKVAGPILLQQKYRMRSGKITTWLSVLRRPSN